MAQLSQDCFASGAQILSVDDAVAAITARFTASMAWKPCPCRRRWPRARGGSRRDVAVAAVHELGRRRLRGPRGGRAGGERRARLFRVAGRVQAGAAAAGPPIAPGEAIRIFTGAPMPEGADTVFMQEDVRLDDAGRALLPPGLKRGANVRPAGEDIAAGKVDRAGESVAAAAGRRGRRGDGAHRNSRSQAREGRAVLERRRDRRARHGPARRTGLRLEPLHVDRDAAAHRLRRQRPRHSPRRQRADRGGARRTPPGRTT